MQRSCKQTPTGTICFSNTHKWLSSGAMIVKILKTQQPQTPPNRCLLQVYKGKHTMSYIVNNMERPRQALPFPSLPPHHFLLSPFPSPHSSPFLPPCLFPFYYECYENVRFIHLKYATESTFSTTWNEPLSLHSLLFLPLIKKHVCSNVCVCAHAHERVS